MVFGTGAFTLAGGVRQGEVGQLAVQAQIHPVGRRQWSLRWLVSAAEAAAAILFYGA